MYEQSHRDYSPLLSASSSARHVVNYTKDNAITTYKAQRDKCQRTEAGERGNYWHADASVMLLRSMQNTRRS